MPLHTLHELDKTEGTVRLRHASATANNTATAGDTSSGTAHDDNASTNSLVLFPTPSPTDLNDPLRWGRWKKHTAFASVCAFTFLTNYGIGGLAPAFYLLSLEFNKTTDEISALLLWPILVLGVFNFFWVPVANYIGKRPVFVFCSGVLAACTIWGALASSFESLLWSNIVGAFAGSSTEALGASIVNDLYFLHERGAKMGWYTAFISGGNTIGPLVCGLLATRLSWRWHKWIAFILTSINFLTVVFFVPETRYYRDEKQDPETVASSRDDVNKTRSADTTSKTGNRVVEDLIIMEPGNVIPKKTRIQELRLWSGVAPGTNPIKMFLRPLPMIIYACVIYASLGYAISLVLTVSVNMLYSFVLQKPPYNMSTEISGLLNIPGLFGNVVGSFMGGMLVDKFCDWRTKRNEGIFEPESRLYMCFLPLVVSAAGCIVFGYGVERTLVWPSLFIGYGMISVALTAIPATTMAYVSDCVLPVNSDALMLVNGIKNIIAFGFLYAILPWVNRVGYDSCFGTQAGIFVGIIGLGILVLIPFGEKIRHRQAQWRIIL